VQSIWVRFLELEFRVRFRVIVRVCVGQNTFLGNLPNRTKLLNDWSTRLAWVLRRIACDDSVVKNEILQNPRWPPMPD